MSYRSECIRGMSLLAAVPNAVFVGQGTVHKANVFYEQLEGVPQDRRLEVPVFENTQMGMSIGMALAGLLPVTIFPRINFLLCALDQLVNHLDKWRLMGAKHPKVIIVTQTGCTRPLDPGVQHKGEQYTAALDAMLTDVVVRDLCSVSEIVEHYEDALDRDESTVLVQRGDMYAQ